MTIRELSTRWWLLVLTQLLHLAVLLLPTLILVGTSSIDFPIVLFASCLVLASACEASFVTQPTAGSRLGVHDKLAIRIAAAVGVTLLVILWAAQIEYYLARDTTVAFQAVGLGGVIVGVLLRVLAIVELGSLFVSDVKAPRQIVVSGIYAWLRHPSEVGLLLIAFGAPLSLGAVVSSLTGLLLLLPVSVWRMRRENAVLYVSMSSSKS